MKNIAMLGHGVVGSGVHELIHRNRDFIVERIGEEITLTKVLIKNREKHTQHPEFHKFTDVFTDDFLNDIDILVEAIGGTEPAFTYVKKALEKGIDVITSNKDLIADKGEELDEIANQHGSTLHFEAAVAGGIPIVRTLKESLAGNKINMITAILNGTTNFILSKMYKEDFSLEAALKVAQDSGFAEQDPSTDIRGYDAARKLSILARLAFEKSLPWRKIGIQGITSIDKRDIEFAKELKYKIKLVATSIRQDDKLYATIQPAFVHRSSLIGKIDNENNTIVLKGDAVGEIVFSGKGAGKLPTASAVIGDIVDVLINKKKRTIECLDKLPMDNSWPYDCNWFIRFKNNNAPVSIDNILTCFNQCDVHIVNLTDMKDIGFVVKNVNEKHIKDQVMEFLATNPNVSMKYYRIIEEVLVD